MKNMTCIVEDNLNLDNLDQGNSNRDNNNRDSLADRIKGDKSMNNTLSTTKDNLRQDNLSRDNNADNNNLGNNVDNNGYYYGAGTDNAVGEVLNIADDILTQDNLNWDDNNNDHDHNNVDNNNDDRKLFFELALTYIQEEHRRYYGPGHAPDAVNVFKILSAHWPHVDAIYIIDIANSIMTTDWVPKTSCSGWEHVHAAY